jgi:hypothetical protein
MFVVELSCTKCNTCSPCQGAAGDADVAVAEAAEEAGRLLQGVHNIDSLVWEVLVGGGGGGAATSTAASCAVAPQHAVALPCLLTPLQSARLLVHS